MSFICNANTNIYLNKNALDGIKIVANYLKEDMQKVFGNTPEIIDSTDKINDNTVIIATFGCDDYLEDDFYKDIKDKREVYKIALKGNNLIIAGSDKRGTIYGIFYISELLGVSAFVNWADVKPAKKDEVIIKDSDMITSKEPSVKYRGFFINDEWPAFGNWCNKRFGGFNAKCYERVFELLLRLKGNYLWPAMWSAQFNLDGPDLLNAELADKMGVIMGMSHHEPCCRNGEEYRYVRGPESKYGDDWNFVRNKEGIINFWTDGLKRNAPFENVITVGMRGEADSTILGHEATLKDNIDYLRDVLKTQNRLIKENVNEDIQKVPRMLALYKEVEPFFYGNDEVKGLKGSDELEGVTLMLCDDNFGNLRTIPDESMKNHNGGYGMYYHFDYHGSPISYEWINSSYLAKIHKEMSKAYDNNIRELWIVNVGDVFTNEMPLGFFLDMAYDYDKWGISNTNAPKEYLDGFVDSVFPTFNEVERETTIEILDGYTKIAHNHRPEAISVKHILDNKRGEDLNELMLTSQKLMYNCQLMYDGMTDANRFPFFEFVYYPAMGYLNVITMWLYTAYNNYLASIGAIKANELNKSVIDCIEFDHKLIDELHSINDGFWCGMGMSEHIGFNNWNEEECRYPVIHQVFPTNKSRIVANVPGCYVHTEGGDWTKKIIKIYTDDSACVELFKTSYKEAYYDVEIVDDFLIPNKLRGLIGSSAVDFLNISVDTANRKENEPGKIIIHGEFGNIPVYVYPLSMKPEITLLEYEEEGLDEYDFNIACGGKYRVDVYMAPSNPPFADNKLLYELNVNGKTSIINAVPDLFAVGDGNPSWYDGVLNNIRISSTVCDLESGNNSISINPLSIGIDIQKIQIVKTN